MNTSALLPALDSIRAATVGEGAEFEALSACVTARHVISARPPRVFAEEATLDPAHSARDLVRWPGTVTWMAPHAKIIADYVRLFWREARLCGRPQSLVVPLVEAHDTTSASGKAALFGLVGVPLANRATVGDAALLRAAIQQFTRRVGPEAVHPVPRLVTDWARDPLTATGADPIPPGRPAAFVGSWVTGDREDRLVMAGSEASPSEPGYLARALEAAQRAVRTIVSRDRAWHALIGLPPPLRCKSVTCRPL